MAIPIILDCDPGTDDAVAILLALASPELAVLAVTVAGGNVGLEHTLANALALTALAGSDVAVHAGAERPLLGAFTSEVRVHGENGLGGVVLPAGGSAAPGLACDVIRRILREAAEPVTLVGIGPATNLALALTSEPTLTARVRQIVLMSGAWGEGNVTPAAEFNAWSDPEALAILLASGCRVVFATLDLTAQALVTPARVAAWRELDSGRGGGMDSGRGGGGDAGSGGGGDAGRGGGPGRGGGDAGLGGNPERSGGGDSGRGGGPGRCLRAACDIQASVPLLDRFGDLGTPLHDPCALAWLIRPDLFTVRECSARMDLGPGPSRGRTLIDRWGRSGDAVNAAVLETVDADGLFRLLGERLALLP